MPVPNRCVMAGCRSMMAASTFLPFHSLPTIWRRSEGRRVIGPLRLSNAERAILAAFRDSPDLAKGYSLKVDAEGLTNLSELMVGAGQIESPVDWSTVLDQQYLPEDARTSF